MGCLVEKEGDLRWREWIETNADGMGARFREVRKGKRRFSTENDF